MPIARLDFLLACLQRGVDTATRTISEVDHASAERAFELLERAGVMNPTLERLYERKQEIADGFFEGVLRINRQVGELLAARRAGEAPGAGHDEEPDDDPDVDGGEEPEDAPELQAAPVPRARRAAPRRKPAAAKAKKPAAKAAPKRPRRRPPAKD